MPIIHTYQTAIMMMMLIIIISTATAARENKLEQCKHSQIVTRFITQTRCFPSSSYLRATNSPPAHYHPVHIILALSLYRSYTDKCSPTANSILFSFPSHSDNHNLHRLDCPQMYSSFFPPTIIINE